MRRARALWAVAIAITLVVAATRAVGVPDFAAVSDFFTGNYPTSTGALASAEVLIWVAVAVIALNMVRAAAMAEVRSAVQILRQRRQRGIVVLLAGGLLLGVGLARHTTSDYSMCCGSVGEAKTVTQLLP